MIKLLIKPLIYFNRHLSILLVILTTVIIYSCASIPKNIEPDEGPTYREEDLGDAYTQMGAMFFVDGKFDIAMEQFQKALKEDIGKYGKIHSKIARDYFNIGTVHIAKGNTTDGLSYYKTVKEICENDTDKLCSVIMEMINRNLNMIEHYEKRRNMGI